MGSRSWKYGHPWKPFHPSIDLQGISPPHSLLWLATFLTLCNLSKIGSNMGFPSRLVYTVTITMWDRNTAWREPLGTAHRPPAAQSYGQLLHSASTTIAFYLRLFLPHAFTFSPRERRGKKTFGDHLETKDSASYQVLGGSECPWPKGWKGAGWGETWRLHRQPEETSQVCKTPCHLCQPHALGFEQTQRGAIPKLPQYHCKAPGQDAGAHGP